MFGTVSALIAQKMQVLITFQHCRVTQRLVGTVLEARPKVLDQDKAARPRLRSQTPSLINYITYITLQYGDSQQVVHVHHYNLVITTQVLGSYQSIQICLYSAMCC